MILLIASMTLCNATHKKKQQRRGLHFDEAPSGYLDPPEHESGSNGWNSDTPEWSSDPHEWNGDDEENEEEPIESETWDEDPSQSWPSVGSSHGWSGTGATQSWPSQSWPSVHSSKKWKSSSHSIPGSVKTVVKEIPVPYERPIKIENPVYTPVEKHIPVENHVPVVKYVEKPVPKYVDHPIPVPVVKEEHVPQPYDQKVKVIVQKVYVHVPSPPQLPKHTIIIRKRIKPNPNILQQQKKHKPFFGFL